MTASSFFISTPVLRTSVRQMGAALVGFAFLLSASVQAQTGSYPQKPIKLIVPLAAGSAVDNAARIVMALTGRAASIPVRLNALRRKWLDKSWQMGFIMVRKKCSFRTNNKSKMMQYMTIESC